MSIVYIGVGSNIGDRNHYIDTALNLIKRCGISVIKTSSIIETEPEGYADQNKFLNCVIKVETELTPVELLSKLNEIESALGRVRTVKNGPRTIDLDILLFDDITINTPNLTIPHPLMTKRDFVMNPLSQIEPALAGKILSENN